MKAKRFTRIAVTPKDVGLPFVVFMTMNLIILATASIVAPMKFGTMYHAIQDEFGRADIDGVQGCMQPKNVPSGLFDTLLLALDLVLIMFTLFQNSPASNVKAEYNF